MNWELDSWESSVSRRNLGTAEYEIDWVQRREDYSTETGKQFYCCVQNYFKVGKIKGRMF